MVLFRCSYCFAFFLFVVIGSGQTLRAAARPNDDIIDEDNNKSNRTNKKVIVSAVPPVVGILSEPIQTDQNTTEFVIAASYVKWLEVSGARSIPIPYDATASQVEDMFRHHAMDGVLFPGGAGKQLPVAARHIWKLAQQINAKQNDEDDDGYLFPIWGTCLGFEYLLMLASDNDDILQGGFDSENISLPLQLHQWTPQQHQHKQYPPYLQNNDNNKNKIVASSSKLYRGLENMVQTHNITLNNHMYGITPARFQNDVKLTSMFHITSTNLDRQGRPFVSTMEPHDAMTHPYYGVQYHPEKNTFEYGTYPGTNIPYEAIDHSPEGMQLTTHLGRFFVDLMRTPKRKTTHTTSMARTTSTTSTSSVRLRPTKQTTTTTTTYYPPVYTYPHKVGITFQEYYVIPSSATVETSPESSSSSSASRTTSLYIRR